MWTFRNHLHEVITDAKRGSFLLRFFSYYLMKQLCSSKSMKLLEKEFERPQRNGMWFVTKNIDSHSIE